MISNHSAINFQRIENIYHMFTLGKVTNCKIKKKLDNTLSN